MKVGSKQAQSICTKRQHPVRRRPRFVAAIYTAALFFMLPLLVLADSSSSFDQTNWGGGLSSSLINTPSAWTKYFAKEASLSVVNSGADLVVVGAIINIEHTSDSDFALARDSITHTDDADFTTTVGGVAPVLTNVVASGGGIRLATGQTTGTYTSSLMDAGTHYGYRSLAFSATVPSGTELSADGDAGVFIATIQVRAGDSTTPGDASWTPYEEVANGFVIGDQLEKRYFQYHVQLDTTNAAVTPSLDDITVNYVNYPSGRDASTFVEGVEVTGGSVTLKTGFNAGSYFSAILDLGKARELSTLDFEKTTPSGASVNMLIRAGSQPSPTASPSAWTDWQSVSNSGDSIAGLGLKRYVQYKAELTATSGSAPTLDLVRINYRGDPTVAASLTSSRFYTEDPVNHMGSIMWTEDETLPGGADVQLQLATGAIPGDILPASFVGPDGTSGTYWNAADDDNGGCFKRGAWVACTKLPAALQDITNDDAFAYKVNIVPGSNTSPVVSDVVVRYGTGAALDAVTVIPMTGIEFTENAVTPDTAAVGVVLHTQPATDVVIDFASSDTNEVTVAPASLTFTNANWDQPQDLTLTSVDETTVDGDQTVTITGTVNAASSDDAYDAVNVPSVTVVNKDNDKPIATITATDANAAELGQDPGTFTITLTPAPASSVPVTLSVTGTANHAGSDYLPVIASPVTVTTSGSATLTVTPVNDSFIEGNETIVVGLSSGAGYDVGIPSSATVTIIDDDVPSVPTVTVTASSTNARESTGQEGFFTINRTGLTTNPLGVFFSMGGTATAVSDYKADKFGGSVIIQNGDSNVVLAVTPVNDSVVEGNETVILTVSDDGNGGANYVVGSPGSATVTIVDDDTGDTGGGGGGGGGGGAINPWLYLLLGMVYLSGSILFRVTGRPAR